MSVSSVFRIGLTSLLGLVLISAASMAGSMDLSSAKKAGLIGEKSDGLVAATLPNPSGEVSSLVANTNRGRMEVYRQTAAKEGIPVAEVQKIAAQKMFNMASSGEFLMVDGQWIKKK